MRFVYGLLGIIAGTLILKYSPRLLRFFGRDPDAEQIFDAGLGGTFFFIKIVGLAIVVISTLYMIGLMDL